MTYVNSGINLILMTFRMPLFFFISGFFMYSSQYNLILLQHRTKNRILKQLLPTIIFFTLYIILSGKSFSSGIASPNKAGYWFTFVSVEIYLIIAPILYFFSINRYCKQYQAIILTLLGMISYIAKCLIAQADEIHPLIAYLDLNFIAVYLPYVILGCIVKMLWNEYEHHMIKLLYFCLAIIIFCISYMFDFFVRDLILGICGIYAMFYLFYCIPERFFSYKIGKLFILIGTSTLEIYLLHYFVFGFITQVHPVFDLLSPLLNTADSIFEFPSILFIVIIIASSCLFVVKAMKSLRIYNLFFPEPNSFLCVKNKLFRIKS